MSGLVSSLPRPVRQRGSRAAHRCCTRVTNVLLQCTQWPRWTREWLAPNTIRSTQTQQLQQGRGFASDTKAVGAAAASDAATAAPATTEVAASASAYFPSAAIASAAPPSASVSTDARSPRRVRHVLFTVHGYLGLPRPFFLFRAPAVNQGFYTVDFSYSSGDDLNTIAQQLGETVRATIAQLSERERAKAKARREPQHYMRNNQQPQHSTQPPAEELRLNFVCHSMGGLVLRAAISSGLIPVTLPEEAQAASGPKPSVATAAASGSRFAALADQPAESDESDALLPVTMGRVVMIATPNRGSLYARTLARIPGVKRVVLSFASMSVPNPRHVVDWMGGAIKGSGWRNLLSGAPSADSASSSSAAPPDASASGVLPDVLACGDLMMSRSADWFCTHLSWPRELYPRTLVIAGTMGLNNLLPRPHDGTIALEETILPLPSDTEAATTKQPSASSSGSASSADSEHADAAFAAAAATARGSSTGTAASKSSRRVALSMAGSLHMSFNAPHSALVAHPGVIASSLQFLLTGDAEPPQRRSHWD